jgi:hypothetical protein
MSPQRDASSQIEYLAWFRFPVTWTYIGAPAPGVQAEVASEPLLASPSWTLAPIAPAPLSQNPVTLDEARAEDGRPPTGSARWEMMVPKMAGPPARSVATLRVGAAPALAAGVPKAIYLSAPAISPAAPVSALPAPATASFAPLFSLGTPKHRILPYSWPPIVFALIAIAAVSFLIWGLSGLVSLP